MANAIAGEAECGCGYHAGVPCEHDIALAKEREKISTMKARILELLTAAYHEGQNCASFATFLRCVTLGLNGERVPDSDTSIGDDDSLMNLHTALGAFAKVL